MAFTDDGLLDETNLRLLDELQRDARLSIAELGRRVGLSAPAVAERVARLESEGVITGYRAELDPRALGYSLGVVIRIRPRAAADRRGRRARARDARGRRVPPRDRARTATS